MDFYQQFILTSSIAPDAAAAHIDWICSTDWMMEKDRLRQQKSLWRKI